MAYAALIIICILLKTKLTDRNVNVFFCVGHFRNGVNCLPPANSNLLNEGFCSSVKETFQNWVRGCVVLSEWWGQPLQLQGKRVKWRCWVQWGHGQAVSLGFLPSVLLLSNPRLRKRAILAACPAGIVIHPGPILGPEEADCVFR